MIDLLDMNQTSARIASAVLMRDIASLLTDMTAQLRQAKAIFDALADELPKVELDRTAQQCARESEAIRILLKRVQS